MVLAAEIAPSFNAGDRQAMGFIAPTPPPFDVQEWKAKPHLERVKPLAQDWAVNGFGTPGAIYLLYIISSWATASAGSR